ncbi:kinetochore mis13 [Fusarium mundagurra]|uniref:Kinetochore mis13 n=1 Tax=Fusarium mundagurra TaxID=1567541 RepID=A0A8H5Y1T3_9HYPO|nr:kinetochore mis13 [Fusarium mundagurra]
MSNEHGRRLSKSLAAAAATDYEHDDDFAFVGKSKRIKADMTDEPKPEAVPEPKARTSEKVCKGSDEREIKVPKRPSTRRSTQRSGEAQEEEGPQPAPTSIPEPKPEPQPETVPEAAPASRVNGAPKKRGSRAKPTRPPPDWDNSPQREPPVQSATIALPMSDAPIINRNKEMRKKGGNSNRRSSLGNRGRRASSLIESGQTATPHREVDPADFYKHIEAEGLTEPRRMKQLLTWCGERALAGKPPHGTPNSNAILGARAIQDQLLKDFAAGSEFSDWFSREDDAPNVPVVLRPDPRNMELDEKLAQLEINIKRLQDQKKAWQAIRKPPPEHRLSSPKARLGLLGFLADETASFDTIRSQTESKLRTIQSPLEFQVDQLADNVHKLEQRVLVAGKEADKVLSVSALRLRQREEREKASAGTRDMPVIEVQGA